MHPFRFPRLWLTLGWILIALIVFLSLWPQTPQPLKFQQGDKLAHAGAYMLLMLWFANIYPKRSYQLWLGAGFFALGIFLEILQGLSAYRTFAFADMIANGFGIFIGLYFAKTPLAACLSHLDTWLLRLG